MATPDADFRYPEPVIPPLFQRTGEAGAIAARNLRKHHEQSLRLYLQTVVDLSDAGVPVEDARAAARAFLLQPLDK